MNKQTDFTCDSCEMKKYYAKVFNIHFLSKEDCPAKKLCNAKEPTNKKGESNGK